jgi:adenylyl- and sulfurtransferase ThiI
VSVNFSEGKAEAVKQLRENAKEFCIETKYPGHHENSSHSLERMT